MTSEKTKTADDIFDMDDSENELIMERIKEALTERKFAYQTDPDNEDKIVLLLNIDQKKFGILIKLKHGKIQLILIFPFKVQSSFIPLVSLYKSDFDFGKSFAHLDIEKKNGRLFMQYSYFCNTADQFINQDFHIYLNSMIVHALDSYEELCRLSSGKLNHEEKILYRKTLEATLAELDDTIEEDDADSTKDLPFADGNDPDLSFDDTSFVSLMTKGVH